MCDGRALLHDGQVPSSGALAFQELLRVLVLDFECLYFGNAITRLVPLGKGLRSIKGHPGVVKLPVGYSQKPLFRHSLPAH